jgi:hypothetical protein
VSGILHKKPSPCRRLFLECHFSNQENIMWKIVVGFVLFAALAMFVIMKGGDNLDMGGEKHGADAVHAPEPAKAGASAAAAAAPASAAAPAAAAAPASAAAAPASAPAAPASQAK